MNLTGSVYCADNSTDYFTIAAKSLDFDASIYSYCEISGTLNFSHTEYGESKYDSFSANRDVIVYNIAGNSYYLESFPAYVRFMYDSNNFYIQIMKNVLKGKSYALTSSNITAIFYN